MRKLPTTLRGRMLCKRDVRRFLCALRIEMPLSSISTLSRHPQFQSRDDFSSPAKTVRYASLCLYLGVWIIVSPLPPRFLKRDASSFVICLMHGVVVRCIIIRMLTRVLEFTLITLRVIARSHATSRISRSSRALNSCAKQRYYA